MERRSGPWWCTWCKVSNLKKVGAAITTAGTIVTAIGALHEALSDDKSEIVEMKQTKEDE